MSRPAHSHTPTRRRTILRSGPGQPSHFPAAAGWRGNRVSTVA